MATPGKASKKEAKRQTPAKSSLNTPFKNQWQPLSNKNWHSIKKSIRCKLESMEHHLYPQSTGWTDMSARRQLAIGINEVTKALERNQLRLVLVCKLVFAEE
uniref:Uncharacterized protein n=1 Tax=Gadus morhua TaxID=8049 RepID=A0A8C5AGR1_GADMO